MHEPKNFQAIMLSSTFTDLEKHRQAAIEAIHNFPFRAECMEHKGARADLDVLQSSLQMVRDSVAYVGVISRKYGQTPVSKDLNPDQLSITELEFNEARRLGRPILLFLMSEKHRVTEADVELDPEKRKKLDAFRERAKRMSEDSELHRVWGEFDSPEEFSNKVGIAIGKLAQYLGPPADEKPVGDSIAADTEAKLARPPALCALPRYLGSHAFVGRKSELETLSDWCAEADPNPMLLYEAIGGSGKSMLTWEWLTRYADNERSDWAGRFWFSFYEKGAVMSAFCRHALAYITERPVVDFAKLRTADLAERLIAHLEQCPWLLVLDGLERVLVAYHRHDAAQLADEEADTAADQIGKRNPCAAIRPEDDDLLRRLAAAAPSKILVSSRLTPQALISRNGLPVPGVRRETLGGLRPPDAETMLGVRGNSNAIRDYLQKNCDCHPLTIGALAGLINAYPRDHGNFDQWLRDPHHGGALDLGKLDLVQRRNHILKAAVDALAPANRQLLHTLALLQGGADYNTLTAFNPHLPPEPEEPKDPTHDFFWAAKKEEEKTRKTREYEAARTAYMTALAAWKIDTAVRAAPGRLADTIRDLEQRGLLQYEANERRYDLHPVVRGVVAGQMATDETQRRGQEVFDYFNSLPHNPWDQAEALEDIAPGLQLVRVLLRMNRYDEAMRAYRGDLANALLFNLEARAETQSLLKPFFPDGWDGEPVPLGADDRCDLLNEAALSLQATQPEQAGRLLERALRLAISESNAREVATRLRNAGNLSYSSSLPADAERCCALALEVSKAADEKQGIFSATLFLFLIASSCGNREAAARLWVELDGMGRDWSRSVYRPGDAEEARAVDLFYRGELTEGALRQAENLAKAARNRGVIGTLHRLRGEWQLQRGELELAIDSLSEAVRMSREVDDLDIHCEALLALARFRVGDSFDARAEAERFSELLPRRKRGGGNLAVAELWHALGERGRAIEHALRAHKSFVADGEPYVWRYWLDRTRALLTQLGAPLPEIPRYDPANAKIYSFEADVRAFIDKLNAERAEKKKREV